MNFYWIANMAGTIDGNSKLKVIHLNVGTIFETTHYTLSKAGEFFQSILEGTTEIAKDNNGRIFIDRDPEVFKILLDFLRSDYLIIPEGMSQKVLIESNYYKMQLISPSKGNVAVVAFEEQ